MGESRKTWKAVIMISFKVRSKDFLEIYKKKNHLPRSVVADLRAENWVSQLQMKTLGYLSYFA